MWQADTRCSTCIEKEKCADRKEIYSVLSPLINKLNTEPVFVNGPGDGILIISCADYRNVPRD